MTEHRARPADDDEQPGLVIGPTTGDADVQREARRPVRTDSDRRPDERIADDVRRWLDRHGRLDARGIRVDVRDGVVVLEGTVADAASRRVAETIAEEVSGVRAVQSRLELAGE